MYNGYLSCMNFFDKTNIVRLNSCLRGMHKTFTVYSVKAKTE